MERVSNGEFQNDLDATNRFNADRLPTSGTILLLSKKKRINVSGRFVWKQREIRESKLDEGLDESWARDDQYFGLEEASFSEKPWNHALRGAVVFSRLPLLSKTRR